MAFDWLTKFHQSSEKPSNYAEKTLAAYRLGMRGKGSIAGVVVEAGEDCCEAARALAGQVYHPDEAPQLPLRNCTRGKQCSCVYRPRMTYQQSNEQ
jgi:hypothetical protein